MGLKNEKSKKWESTDFATYEDSYQQQKLLVSDTPNYGVHRYPRGIPSLPTVQSTSGNNGWWSWMVVVCLGACWVAPGRPWDNGGHHGWEVHLAAHFSSVGWLLRWWGLFILARLLGVHKHETSDSPPGAFGLTMGIVRQFLPISMNSPLQTTVVMAELKKSKIHLIPSQ